MSSNFFRRETQVFKRLEKAENIRDFMYMFMKDELRKVSQGQMTINKFRFTRRLQ